MDMIDEALKFTTDTKACVVGRGAVEATAEMFRSLFPKAKKAIVVSDPRTRAVAGEHVIGLLKAAGVEVGEHVICPDGSWFHAEYRRIDEVRDAIASVPGAMPVAVGAGTINDLVKRSAEEAGVRYMVVGTAASMDGYTSYGAAITRDGIKQTMSCKAPLGCIVDSELAAAAPKEMVASGFADLIAKVPAGADWILADAIGSEAIHAEAWRFVQGPLRESLMNPSACAAGDVTETDGFTGIMGYASTIVSGIGIALIQRHFGWGLTLCAIAGFALVGMILFLLAWNAQANGYNSAALKS